MEKIYLFSSGRWATARYRIYEDKQVETRRYFLDFYIEGRVPHARELFKIEKEGRIPVRRDAGKTSIKRKLTPIFSNYLKSIDF
ncbi:MAG: hypothetical protein ABH811_01645 [archaeon]